MDQREYFLNLLFQNWIVQYHRNEETHLVPLLLKKTPEPEGLTWDALHIKSAGGSGYYWTCLHQTFELPFLPGFLCIYQKGQKLSLYLTPRSGFNML
jgi:hypothetical protein